MLKLSDNPSVLSTWVDSVADLEGCWWVAHTKARLEKAFARDLSKQGIGYFLPLLERVTYSGGKKRHTMLPLFPSYVFFCGTQEDRQAAMRTDRLCRAIGVSDQEQLVTELLLIEKALQHDIQLDSHVGVTVGETSRVKAGPFAGVEGRVLRQSGKLRFILQVGVLGQGASMEIDADLLEPIGR